MNLTELSDKELSELCDSISKHPEGTREVLIARLEHSGRFQIDEPETVEEEPSLMELETLEGLAEED